MLDGLMLTGGDDPHPHLFDEEPHPENRARGRAPGPVRDRAVLTGHEERDMPLLGCLSRRAGAEHRACGGDIYQDISKARPRFDGERHTQQRLDDGPWHRIRDRHRKACLGRRCWAGLGNQREFVSPPGLSQAGAAGWSKSATCAADGLIEALEDARAGLLPGGAVAPGARAARAPRPLFDAFVAAAAACGCRPRGRTRRFPGDNERFSDCVIHENRSPPPSSPSSPPWAGIARDGLFGAFAVRRRPATSPGAPRTRPRIGRGGGRTPRRRTAGTDGRSNTTTSRRVGPRAGPGHAAKGGDRRGGPKPGLRKPEDSPGTEAERRAVERPRPGDHGPDPRTPAT